MQIRKLAIVLAGALLLAACGNGDDAEVDAPDAAETEGDYDISQQPDDAAAGFASPADGDTVSAPVTVELTADGVTLAPAGVPAAGEGHLHVMVDIGCAADGEVIPGPSDEAEADGYFHLGDGSDSREIPLEPGTYELCVQLADGIHVAYGATETITVTVE
jgi:hypothetical protein